MLNPENNHTSNITQTEQVTLRNKYVDTSMHVTTINFLRSHEFEREK